MSTVICFVNFFHLCSFIPNNYTDNHMITYIYKSDQNCCWLNLCSNNTRAVLEGVVSLAYTKIAVKHDEMSHKKLHDCVNGM